MQAAWRAAADDRLAHLLRSQGTPAFLRHWYAGPLWRSLRQHPCFPALMARRRGVAQQQQQQQQQQGASAASMADALSAMSTGRMVRVLARGARVYVGAGPYFQRLRSRRRRQEPPHPTHPPTHMCVWEGGGCVDVRVGVAVGARGCVGVGVGARCGSGSSTPTAHALLAVNGHAADCQPH